MTVVIPPDPEGGRCEPNKDEKVCRWHELTAGMVILISSPPMRTHGRDAEWSELVSITNGVRNVTLERRFKDGSVEKATYDKRFTWFAKKRT